MTEPKNSKINDFLLSAELCFEPHKNYLFDLSNLSLIKVSGENAADFLQGQLSCDIRLVTTSSMQQGALCNLKGRVLALLDIVYYENNYWLILPKALVAATLKSLEKAALLSRITLLPQDNLAAWGMLIRSKSDNFTPLVLPHTVKAVTTTQDSCCYQISPQKYMILTFDPNALPPNKLIHAEMPIKHELAWHFLQLEEQRIQIYPETRGLFTPHRLNLHHSETLSFNKGCYKGQEIIARTHYRATLKHHLFTASLQCKNSPTPLRGAKLLEINGTLELGELIDYCPIDADNHYLVVCSMLKTATNSFRFETSDEPLALSDDWIPR